MSSCLAVPSFWPQPSAILSLGVVAHDNMPRRQVSRLDVRANQFWAVAICIVLNYVVCRLAAVILPDVGQLRPLPEPPGSRRRLAGHPHGRCSAAGGLEGGRHRAVALDCVLVKGHALVVEVLHRAAVLKDVVVDEVPAAPADEGPHLAQLERISVQFPVRHLVVQISGLVGGDLHARASDIVDSLKCIVPQHVVRVDKGCALLARGIKGAGIDGLEGAVF